MAIVLMSAAIVGWFIFTAENPKNLIRRISCRLHEDL